MSQKTLTNAEKIEILRAGQASAFWAILAEVTRENIEVLEAQILDKVSNEEGHENEPLSDLEVDRLRDKRSAMVELLALPASMISDMTIEDPEADENFDPFAQHKKPEDTG